MEFKKPKNKKTNEIKRKTKHVVGTPKSMGGSGDPSVVTAYGVYMGMKGAAQFLWGNDKLNGKKPRHRQADANSHERLETIDAGKLCWSRLP